MTHIMIPFFTLEMGKIVIALKKVESEIHTLDLKKILNEDLQR